MVANIRGYTPNYGFKLINFDTPRWHTLEYANWSQLDSMFLQFGASGIRGEWQNATEYLIGERVFDVVNGLLYRCLVQHVSATSGSFADDRLLHPTFWSLQLGGVPVFRGDWVAGNSYAVGDIVNVGYEYYLGTSNHVASEPFPGNGPEWQTVFDATEVVTDAQTAADAAELSATNAANSESDAENAADIALNAQSAFKWTFDDALTMQDPGVGDIRFDVSNLNIATIATVAISAQSADINSPDVSSWVETWDDSTNTALRGTLLIRGVDAPENFVVLNITGSITDNGVWLRIPVAHVSHGGAFALENLLSVGFSRTGNAGVSGAGSGDMVSTNNLSDVQSDVTSRSNLGVGAEDTPTFAQLIINDPATLPKHTATKEYVDGAPSLYVGITQPPIATTQDGSLWWDSDKGTLFLLYNDTSSRQWVQAVATPGVISPIPSGSKMLFIQAAAPTGWTKVTDTNYNDIGMRITTGGNGGNLTGSVAWTTCFTRVATDNYTLLAAHVAKHYHPFGTGDLSIRSGGSGAGGNGGSWVSSFGLGETNYQTTGDSPHAHGVDLRLKYIDAIIATKD